MLGRSPMTRQKVLLLAELACLLIAAAGIGALGTMLLFGCAGGAR